MPKETQTAKDTTEYSEPEKTAKPAAEFGENEPVTVIWKSWGTENVPRDKVTYFDRQQFVGGVGRRIPYKDALRWKQQGHGVYILPVDADEIAFMRATGHAPVKEGELEALLRSIAPDKLAAILGPDGIDKITALQRKQ
jgi:hypothetical protein